MKRRIHDPIDPNLVEVEPQIEEISAANRSAEFFDLTGPKQISKPIRQLLLSLVSEGQTNFQAHSTTTFVARVIVSQLARVFT